jgi:hypothetical protein
VGLAVWVILRAMDGADADELAELRCLAERALEAGSARFRLVDVVAALGDEPLYQRLGIVDFRRRSYDGGDQRIVDGVLYGFEDGMWTRLELGSREPIGPAWVLDLLTGMTSVTTAAQGPPGEAGARLVEGVADLFAARKATGRSLDDVGGAPRSSMRAVPVSVVIGADGLAERVSAQVHDHKLMCEFWDYGVVEAFGAPAGAVSVQRRSFMKSVLAARRSRRST